jgi:hypothetical protein
MGVAGDETSDHLTVRLFLLRNYASARPVATSQTV